MHLPSFVLRGDVRRMEIAFQEGVSMVLVLLVTVRSRVGALVSATKTASRATAITNSLRWITYVSLVKMRISPRRSSFVFLVVVRRMRSASLVSVFGVRVQQGLMR